MNKYYTICSSDDLKVIGYYPQTFITEDDIPLLYENNGQRQVKSRVFPDFVPNCILKLHDKAKPTNFLDNHVFSFGIIIDEKFKKILKNYILPPHRFYSIKVIWRDTQLDYYWFHYISNTWEFVDLKKSTAQIYKKFDFEVDKVIDIPDLDRINEFESKLSFREDLMLNELFFKDSFPNYDVLEIDKVQYLPRLISEKLLIGLKEGGITGFEANYFDKIKG